MVEKFNFYDIYGYLLPGLVLISLAWLPFGVVFGIWPKPDLGSAVLVLILAYVVGHFTQTLAAPLFPSKKPDRFGNPRYPSDLMLDMSDTKFTCDLKKNICQLSAKILGLELKPEDLGENRNNLKKLNAEICALQKKEQEVGTTDLRKRQQALTEQLKTEDDPGKKAALESELGGVQNTITEKLGYPETRLTEKSSAARLEAAAIASSTHLRTDAFFQARSALLKAKGSSYWEQFEGLYALMRGVSFALSLATYYLAGWSFGLGSKAWFGRLPLPIAYFGGASALAVLLLAVLSWPKSSPPPSELPRWKRISLRSTVVVASFAAGAVLSSLTLQQQAEVKKLSVTSLVSIVTVQPEAAPEGTKLLVQSPAFLVGFLALLAAAVSFRCHGAYKAFADLFAEHVWRDFANIEAKWTQPENKWSPQSQEFLSLPPQES